MNDWKDLKNGWYWVSTPKGTYGVEVEDGWIVDTAPMGRRFLGKHFRALYFSLNKHRGFKWGYIGEYDEQKA